MYYHLEMVPSLAPCCRDNNLSSLDCSALTKYIRVARDKGTDLRSKPIILSKAQIEERNITHSTPFCSVVVQNWLCSRRAVIKLCNLFARVVFQMEQNEFVEYTFNMIGSSFFALLCTRCTNR